MLLPILRLPDPQFGWSFSLDFAGMSDLGRERSLAYQPKIRPPQAAGCRLFGVPPMSPPGAVLTWRWPMLANSEGRSRTCVTGDAS